MIRLSVIDRYMLKRVTWPLAAGIPIGMAALLLQRLIRLLDLFANRGGPMMVILKMLGNLVPQYLTTAVPQPARTRLPMDPNRAWNWRRRTNAHKSRRCDGANGESYLALVFRRLPLCSPCTGLGEARGIAIAWLSIFA